MIYTSTTGGVYMNEIWKDITGYCGKYQVSTFGNVRSLNFNRTGRCKNLKFKVSKDGYFCVALYGCGEKQKWFFVHRLVAQEFIPNTNNLPFVNHIDEDKKNNNVENLEWCTPQYNVMYGTARDRAVETMYEKLQQKRGVEMTRPTRFYSDRQEKLIAKALNGKQTSNSGATSFQKGDVIIPELMLVECKTVTKEQTSFTIKRDWIDKNKEEMFAMGLDYSALAFDFGDGKQHYIIDEKLFTKLINFLKEEKENE